MVLLSLQFINDNRMKGVKEREEGKRVGVSSSSSSGGSGNNGVVLRRSSRICSSSSSSYQQQQEIRELNGVLAESKITAFELWREICVFL